MTRFLSKKRFAGLAVSGLALTLAMAGCNGSGESGGPALPLSTATPASTSMPSGTPSGTAAATATPQAGLSGRIAFRVADFNTGALHVVLIRPDGSGRSVVATGESPALSPRGDQVAFATARGLEVLALRGSAASGTPKLAFAQPTIQGPGGPIPGVAEPAWSPDGALLAFATSRGSDVGAYGIWIARPNGNGSRQITRGLSKQEQVNGTTVSSRSSDIAPTWHPSGRFFTFLRLTSFYAGGSATGGQGRQFLDATPVGALSPTGITPPSESPLLAFADWNRDGGRLAFVSGFAIYVSARGGTPRRLSPAGASLRDPSWSPDGRSLVAVRDTGPLHTDLVVLNESGSITPIPNTQDAQAPDWGAGL